MQLKQGLTKENFWNRMMEEYPNAMKKFCKWIDEYKEAVGWHKLFNAGWSKGVSKSNDGPLVSLATTEAPKFHDLPYAFQMGMWISYLQQRGGCQWEIVDMFTFDLRLEIEGFFKELLEDEAKMEL